MTNLIKARLSWIICMMLSRWTASLRVNRTSIPSNSIMHLHSIRALFHINTSIFACSLCCFRNWVDFAHLDDGGFWITLGMQWTMSTTGHTLVLNIWISLRSVVLIILFRSTRFHRFIVMLICYEWVHISTHRMSHCLHMLLLAKFIFGVMLLIFSFFRMACFVLGHRKAHWINLVQMHLL